MRRRPYRPHRRKHRKRDPEPKTLRQERKEFHKHLATYLVMSAFFIAINLFSSRGPGFLWFQWPMLGWGIGVVFHFMKAYVPAFYDEEQEEEYLELKETESEAESEEKEEVELEESARPWKDQDLV